MRTLLTNMAVLLLTFLINNPMIMNILKRFIESWKNSLEQFDKEQRELGLWPYKELVKHSKNKNKCKIN